MSTRYTEFRNILKQMNLDYVKKDTPQYKRVMAILDKRCPKREPNELWNKACENCELKYVKKGSPEYDIVKIEYDRLKETQQQNNILLSCSTSPNADKSARVSAVEDVIEPKEN